MHAIQSAEATLRHTLATLRLVEYTSWGATAPTALPSQTGHAPEPDMVIRQVIHGLVDAEPSVGRMENELAAVFNQKAVSDLIDDLYWFSFLEYFALLDAPVRVERHKKALVAQFEAEEDRNRKANRNKSGRTYFLRRKASKLSEGGPSVTGPAASKVSRQNGDDERGYVPRHLRREANCPDPCDRTAPNSRPVSAQSVASTRSDSIESVLSASSKGANVASALLDELIQPPAEEYEGKCELTGIARVLVTAEIIDAPTLESTAGSDEASVVRQAALRRAAVDLIRNEQEHMLDRIASNYVTLFRSIKSVKRDVILGPFPDSLSQLLLILFHRTLPYLRNELTPRLKRCLKRRVSFMFSGVENSEIRKWQSMSGQTSLLVAPQLSSRSASGTAPKSRSMRRESTSAAHTQSPGFPAIDPSSRWKAVGGKAKNAGIALTTFSEAGAMHNVIFSSAYMEMRRELRHALQSDSSQTQQRAGASGSGDPAGSVTPAAVPLAPAPPPRPAGIDKASRPSTRQVGQASPREDVRHVATHRFADDPRPPRWHEAGRRREARLLAHDTAHKFNNANVSPLMGRFLFRNDVSPRFRGSGAMSWST